MTKRYRRTFRGVLLRVLLSTLLFVPSVGISTEAKTSFVVQLTRTDENFGHRRAFMQIDKILTDLGEDKLHFTVVAYEEGIQALTADNKKTNQLLTKLANRGVTFKACRISMKAWELTESDFPLEVEYVPAGAPEVIQLQMQGFRYWHP